MYFKSFALENFRVFKEKQDFEFKPITILVGTNSSGKSSVIKALKLMLSSMNQETEMGTKSGHFMRECFRTFSKLIFRNENALLGNFNKVLNAQALKEQGVEGTFNRPVAKIGIEIPYYIFGINKSLRLNLKYSDASEVREGILSEVTLRDPKKNILLIDPENNRLNLLAFYKIFQEALINSYKIIDIYEEVEKLTKGKCTYIDYILRPNLIVNQDVISLYKQLDSIYENAYLGYSFKGEDLNLFQIFQKKYFRKVHVTYFKKKEFIGFYEDLFKNEIKQIPCALNKTFFSYGKELNKFLESSPELFDKVLEFELSYLEKIISNNCSRNIFRYWNVLEFADISEYCSLCSSLVGFEIKEEEFSMETEKASYFIDEFIIDGLTKASKFFEEKNELRTTFIPSIRAKNKRHFEIDDDLFSFGNEYQKIDIEDEYYVNSKSEFKNDLSFNNYFGWFWGTRNNEGMGSGYWFKEFGIKDKMSASQSFWNENNLYKIEFTEENNESGFSKSLIDLGFGYSQILPIINNVCESEEWNFFIEEPEANLHPGLQSKLADLFVEQHIKYNNTFVIETHSEYLIRKLQYLIAKGELNHEDAVIYYFHHPDNIPEGEDHVKKIEFDEKGLMSDTFGPGFFDEADRLSFQLLSLNKGQKN